MPTLGLSLMYLVFSASLNFHSWYSNLVEIQQVAGMTNRCWSAERAIKRVLFSLWGVGGRKAKLHLQDIKYNSSRYTQSYP